MGGFKSLFKIRKPGNGSVFEARVKAASKSSVAKKFPSKDNSFNSKDKKAI